MSEFVLGIYWTNRKNMSKDYKRNAAAMEGKLVAFETQMNESRGEVERLRNSSYVPQGSDPLKGSQSPEACEGEGVPSEWQFSNDWELDGRKVSC